MKYRESEDLNNPDNFWQEQAMITDFSTGIRRAVSKHADEMQWLRAIGVSRLANTPDVMATEEIIRKTQGWSVSKEQLINDPVIQGKP
eukprot:4674169-Heterocapsa_arctica.AAC.1